MIAAAAAAAASVSTAHAEPILKVSARTRIDVTSIARVEGGLRVRGRFVDDGLSEPIAHHTIAIHVDRGGATMYEYAVPTHADGTFDQFVPLPLGEYRLLLHGGGDDKYAPAPAVERTVDVARRTPALELTAPEVVSVAERRVTVVVEARDPEGDVPLGVSVPAESAVELPVVLLLDKRTIAHLHTRGGRAEHALDVATLGRPGDARTLTARFAGDELRNPVEVSRALRIGTPTMLTAAAAGAELPWKGSLAFTGELTDASGPVAGASVALYASGPSGDDAGREVATALTDAAGRFTAELPGGRLRPGAWFVEARFQPNVSWREPSRSAAIAITAEPPRPLSAVFYVSPLVTALALGGIALARKRPWRHLRTRRAAARERRAAARLPASGLSENRPRLLSALRPAADLGLSGWVLEASTGKPVAGATVRATGADGQRVVPVDEHGWFELPALAPGPVAVDVAAPGYVPERFERALPHRGELRRARILLVPIRARIFATYREATLPLHPAPHAPETCTPRELYHHAERKKLLVEDLGALTALVEETYFSPREPDGAQLAEAERLAAAVQKIL
jgi:Carboxypeptidase regulatory-like domain